MTTAQSIALLSLVTAACGGSRLPAWTSAQTGCPAEEVVIMKDEAVWSARTWTARCRGKTYSCTENNEGQATATVSCKERADDTPDAPSAQDTPCQFDTQCRADRRCHEGRCVEPQR